MSRKGENIYKRKDGRWEGGYCKDRVNGKIKYGYVYDKTYKGVKEKLFFILQCSKVENSKTLTNNILCSDYCFKKIALLSLKEKSHI